MLILGLAHGLMLIGPAVLEAKLTRVDVTPALFVLIAIGTMVVRRNFRTLGLVDSVSGVPNLTALKGNRAAATGR